MLEKVQQDPSHQQHGAGSSILRHWAQIERKQQRNAALQNKINQLYRDFQRDILPEQQRLCTLLAQQTRQLLTLLPLQSFNQQQRQALIRWIEQNLARLVQQPFHDRAQYQALRQKLSESLLTEVTRSNKQTLSNSRLQQLRAEIEPLFGGRQFSDEQIIAFNQNPELFQQAFEQFLANEVAAQKQQDRLRYEQLESVFIQRSNEPCATAQQEQKQTQQQLKDFFNGSEFNKFYKLLANRLHPDKESDPQRRAEKTAWMGQLTQAKKHKDAFVLLSMLRQFAPDSVLALELGAQAEQALQLLFQEKMRKLAREYHQLKHADTPPSIVWRQFGARSNKAIADNLRHHLGELQHQQRVLQKTSAQISSAKATKQLLLLRQQVSVATGTIAYRPDAKPGAG